MCEKCKVAYDLKKGAVFWIGEFIRCHWHMKDRRPSGGLYFQKSFKEFPKHLKVRNRIPPGYILARQPAYGCKGGQSFKRKDLLFEVRLSEAYWVWWRKLSQYLRSLWEHRGRPLVYWLSWFRKLNPKSSQIFCPLKIAWLTVG